ncbi:hypothetical protein [Conexibacter woesei]|uniref:hypothetical protein n=1 Tax=Conexibacter woesei TaxID=191495 RepID=UPI00041604BA|nr:hypothetical protein [Conexibacter woesei]
MSDAAGWAVLRTAVAEARTALGDRLVAAYALGSLVHGGFAPDVSDVDGLLVLDRADAAAAAAIEAVVARHRDQRLSLFWGDWATFGAPPEAARLPPIVRRDLLDCGVAVFGDAPPAGLPRPTGDDLVRETAAFAADWLERHGGVPDPDALLAAGRRETTKMVLFPVRFLATTHAGLAGSNGEAVEWYVNAGGPHARLAAAALRWRTSEIDDPALLTDLPALYAEALDALRAHPAVPDDVKARL